MTKKCGEKKSEERPFTIPDLSGKVYLVTGGNTGLGKETILALSHHNPKKIYMTSRSQEKSLEAINEIKSVVPNAEISFLPCDLTSFESIQSAAQQFQRESDRLDVLVCNAGIMAVPEGVTKEGYEIQFGTNHMGHAFLIHQLLPIMLKTAEEPNSDVRIVNLSSLAYRMSSGLNLESMKGNKSSTLSWMRYGDSKLANLLYAMVLSKKHPSITTVAIHPGVVKTDLIEKLGWFNRNFVYFSNWVTGTQLFTPEVGAYNQTWASVVDKDQLINGEYYQPVGKLPNNRTSASKDEKAANELWDWTQKEIENFLSKNSSEPQVLKTDQ